MRTSKNPICICPKCGKKAEFVKVSSLCRAGDNGYFQTEAWQCSNCMFTPWILPKIEVEIKMVGENDESSSN